MAVKEKKIARAAAPAVLSEGWRRVKFGDVVRDVKVTVDPETSGLERYVAGEHMSTDDLHIRRWGTIGDGYLGPAFHRKFVKGQVLYGSRRTYLRKVAVADFDGICANTTFVLEPKGDAFNTYRELCWWGAHTAMYDKSQTYSVEGTNADLRHYLARLARRSRCFSRCIHALTRAVDLFVRFYNARQIRKRKYPRYPAPLATMI